MAVITGIPVTGKHRARAIPGNRIAGSRPASSGARTPDIGNHTINDVISIIGLSVRRDNHQVKSVIEMLTSRFGIICLSSCLALSNLAYAKEKVTRDGKAKPVVRNLPDIEATPTNSVAVDQELNLYSAAAISNTSVDYGLPHGWNIGLSLLNAQFYNGRSTALVFQPDVLINLEKHWLIGNGQVIVGSQSGVGVLPQAPVFMQYAYLEYQQHFAAWNIDIDTGSYYANAAIAGRQSIGGHINLEMPLYGKWRLNSDYLSGNNAVSATTLKLLYPLGGAWQLGAGVQIPGMAGPDHYIGILGIYWQ